MCTQNIISDFHNYLNNSKYSRILPSTHRRGKLPSEGPVMFLYDPNHARLLPKGEGKNPHLQAGKGIGKYGKRLNWATCRSEFSPRTVQRGPVVHHPRARALLWPWARALAVSPVTVSFRVFCRSCRISTTTTVNKDVVKISLMPLSIEQ